MLYAAAAADFPAAALYAAAAAALGIHVGAADGFNI